MTRRIAAGAASICLLAVMRRVISRSSGAEDQAAAGQRPLGLGQLRRRYRLYSESAGLDPRARARRRFRTQDRSARPYHVGPLRLARVGGDPIDPAESSSVDQVGIQDEQAVG